MNDNLMKVAQVSDFIKLGFVEYTDGSEDPRGTTWEMKATNFNIEIDPWFEVRIARINPDTDYIQIVIDDLQDLEALIAFIQD